MKMELCGCMIYLQEMGQDIVRRGSKEPGRCTKLWLYLHVLKNNTVS